EILPADGRGAEAVRNGNAPVGDDRAGDAERTGVLMFNRVRSLCRNLLQRSAVEADLDRELGAYLEQVTDRNRQSGMDPRAARRAAQLELGGMEQVKEEVRDRRAGRLIEETWRDVCYGARTLRKNAGFACVAALV